MKKILILSHELPSSLMVQKLKEEYGEDIELLTAKEALEQGLKPGDFANFPTYEIRKINTEIPKVELVERFYSSSESGGKGGRARKRSQFKRNNRNF